MVAPSRRTMISEIAVRRMRLRVAAVAAGWAGCDQARSRSAPSAISCCRSGSPSGGERLAIVAAISPSIFSTDCNASFQRRSNSSGDEPIGRIDSIVLPAGMSGLIA
jgi:hypothetical protein